MKRCILYSLSGLVTLSVYSQHTSNRDVPPNILLIVVDDMGFSDIQPFGGEIQTPHINRLAEQGIRFTRFHTSSLSAPTRAMLLTGVDNHQNGLGIMPPLHAENQYMQPGYEGGINHSVMTLAEVLHENNYYTCMAGKWHLGAQKENIPSERGFDQSFTMLGGGAGHFCNSFALSDSEQPVTFYLDNGKRVDKLPDDFYSTRYYTDKMIEYLRKCPQNKPFFSYLAFTAPHDPLQIIPEWKNRNKGMYDGGYDSIRVARLERQRQMGLIPAQTPDTGLSNPNKQWDFLNEKQKKEQSRKMEIYASMIEYVDYSIGRVIKELEEEHKLNNTLILFMSDNGANPKEPESYPGNTKETIQEKYDNQLGNYGNSNSFISLGEAWAEVCNTPYSLYKMTTHEGGICVPLIISGKNMPQKGSIDHSTLLHVTDLFPTILEYTHTQRPSSYHNISLAPLYGKSFVQKLTDTESSPSRTSGEALCFEMKEDKAVIQGKWKAVQLAPPHGDGTTWKLYNLETDIAEQNDLSAIYPAKLKALIELWKDYAKSVGYIQSDHSSMIKEIGAAQFYKYEAKSK